MFVRSKMATPGIALCPFHPWAFGVLSGSFRLAEELGLAELLQRPVGTLSGGEERRVALAAALVDLPETDMLILDERLDSSGYLAVVKPMRSQFG